MTLPGGGRITSEPFDVGGRDRRVDYYPNGPYAFRDDSDSIALYLRLAGSHKKERVRAALLDPAGNAPYELPKETTIFTAAAHVYGAPQREGEEEAAGDPRRGYACFITKEELRRRG
ncbi:BTB/POZ and MATH domain-containing protein 4-like [Panicum miliaceum]|uniref:BTB/POZ and MATH domain-containing protein 4-like n=1 Tax=Panicum miliaceum TaxID=4540 RepID=A0A3L6PN80_PANMI|nr:BTB/POZ and MATH domain-containing protein 4-like [Panicum miliaceum]